MQQIIYLNIILALLSAPSALAHHDPQISDECADIGLEYLTAALKTHEREQERQKNDYAQTYLLLHLAGEECKTIDYEETVAHANEKNTSGLSTGIMLCALIGMVIYHRTQKE